MARWAAIGHETGGGGGLPLSVVPSQALLVGLTPPPSMETHWRWVGVALECIPAAAMLYAVLCVHRICRSFLAGAVFGPAVVHGFRGVGWGFLAMFVTSLVYQAGVTALLSWLASGQQNGLVALGVGPFEMSVLVVGLMMLLLGHVLAEGHRLDVALFRINTSDEIVVASSSGGRTIYTNAGSTRRSGLELAYSGQLAPEWRTHVALSTLSAKFAEAFASNQALLQSDALVVMTERGRRLLLDVYAAPEAKINVIPHGIPDVAFEPAEAARARGFAALSADGEVKALAAMILASGIKGPILHLRGADVGQGPGQPVQYACRQLRPDHHQ